MSRLKITALGLFLFATPTLVEALTVQDVKIDCPIDGVSFTTYQVMSGTQSGMYLDLKPIGAIAAPWPIPKCPSNGFVIYKAKFSGEELTKLRLYVETQEYQAMQRIETNYYLAAKLQQKMFETAAVIAATLLRATWEARPGEQYTRYATEALSAYKQALQQIYTDQTQLVTDQLVAVELERRLGKFEEAQFRLSSLPKRGDLKAAKLGYIVELQLRLVGQRDARPTVLPPMPK